MESTTHFHKDPVVGVMKEPLRLEAGGHLQDSNIKVVNILVVQK